MQLLVWRKGEAQPVAELESDARGVRVVRAEPVVSALVTELGRQPHLPLTLREEREGHRYVTCKRLTPADPDYWQAFAEAVQRRLGLRVTGH